MKTIDEIRRNNLRILADQYKGVGVVAEKVGRSPSQLSQWLNGSSDSKSGNARGMRAASCRHIETTLGLPDGWMDSQHESKSDLQIHHQDGSRTDVQLKNSTPHTGKAANSDAVTAEELVELVNAYVVASAKERNIILTSAKLAAKRATAKVTKATN